MTHLEYFKLQAKNLHRDWKNRSQKYFACDIRWLFRLYNVNPSEEPTLMKAQHLLALSLGRNKWDDLLKEPEETLAYTRKVLEKERLLLKEKMKLSEDVKKDESTGTNKEYHGKVQCLHCGKQFPIDKPNHLPSCDGEAWDLIPVTH